MSDKFHDNIVKRWEIYKPPTRPSLSEIKLFKEIIGNGRNKNGLVLGATPELRDVLHELDYNVYVADLSEKMIKALKKLMRYPDKGELVFIQDWSKLNLPDNTMDVIIGDWVLGNLPNLGLQDKFLDKISRLIKPGGLFVHRHHYYYPGKNLDDVYLEYENYSPSPENDMALAFDLVLLSITPKRAYIQNSFVVADKLKKLITQNDKRNEVWRKFYRIFDKFYLQGGEKKWCYGPKDKQQELMKKYFDCLDVKYGDDHKFAGICPIYVLKNK